MAQKKAVLEEEEYVGALGEIIERDFFPDLPRLKEQTALLREGGSAALFTSTSLRDASGPGNTSVRSRSSVASGWDQPTPTRGDTVAAFDHTETKVVPNRSRGESGGDGGALEEDTARAMTLNRFVATHTSEDNEAFNELQEKAIKDHERRYHWAFDDDPEKGDPKLHLLTDGTWISKEQRQLADEACASKGPKDDRPSAPETWKFRARNPLLFPPELKTTRDICRVEPGSKGQLQIENGPKSSAGRPPRAKKMTVYANSRFSHEEAHTGRSETGEDSVGSQKEYNLVRMTPQIVPGVDASPLMTWGDIEGTPMALGASATPERVLGQPTFEVQDTSRREKLADRLEAEARRRNPASRRRISSTRSLLLSSSRKRSMVEQTPPSRSVRDRLSSVRSVLRTPLGSDAQLRASYSTPVRPARPSSKKRKAQ